MSLQNANTTISVTETPPDLDEYSARIGAVISGSQTQDLPLNGRSWVRLLTLVPGAIDDASGTEDQVRFAGLSQEDNNFLFDGVDATGINHQFEKVDLRLQLSTEAIAEFRVSSALFSADQGGSAGAQVEIVSRSGTNRFQGSLWEFFRNNVFDARPWGSGPLQDFRLNNFGANLGGPVLEISFSSLPIGNRSGRLWRSLCQAWFDFRIPRSGDTDRTGAGARDERVPARTKPD